MVSANVWVALEPSHATQPCKFGIAVAQHHANARELDQTVQPRRPQPVLKRRLGDHGHSMEEERLDRCEEHVVDVQRGGIGHNDTVFGCPPVALHDRIARHDRTAHKTSDLQGKLSLPRARSPRHQRQWRLRHAQRVASWTILAISNITRLRARNGA